MNWKKRGAKLIGSWITGYSGGLGLIFPANTMQHWDLTIDLMLFYPAFAGMIVVLPQVAKVFFEYGNMGQDNSSL